MKANFFASRVLRASLTLCLCVSCALFIGAINLTRAEAADDVREIVKQAETMTLEELARKAIEESNGKTFFGLGSTSRCNAALPLFEKYLQQFDPSYKFASFEWQQPKNNKIYDQIIADSMKKVGTFAMTAVQDPSQIENKLMDRKVLVPFIPKQWREDGGIFSGSDEWLPLQSLILRVFMFNNTGKKEWKNCWDLVGPDAHVTCVNIDSETVGKNFLYMLTKDEYAKILADAFNALSPDKKKYFQPVIDSLESDAEDFGLGPDGKYAMAWIKLWLESQINQTDDALICNMLAAKSAQDQVGICVYSKLRGIDETENVSKANISIAAYQDDYVGISGYSYGTWFFLTHNSPMPWTSCAFIAFMTCTAEGFSPWGRDMGGYASNPKVAAEIEELYHHSKAGYVDGENKFDCANDRGYNWWRDHGNIVIEDADYCAEVSFTVGSWIETLSR